jgi:hypothetical protein
MCKASLAEPEVLILGGILILGAPAQVAARRSRSPSDAPSAQEGSSFV